MTPAQARDLGARSSEGQRMSEGSIRPGNHKAALRCSLNDLTVESFTNANSPRASQHLP